ncbi:MAG: hypothetical protein AB8B50_17110 [Pirellulaceae bacterium]
MISLLVRDPDADSFGKRCTQNGCLPQARESRLNLIWAEEQQVSGVARRGVAFFFLAANSSDLELLGNQNRTEFVGSSEVC